MIGWQFETWHRYKRAIDETSWDTDSAVSHAVPKGARRTLCGTKIPGRDPRRSPDGRWELGWSSHEATCKRCLKAIKRREDR